MRCSNRPVWTIKICRLSSALVCLMKIFGWQYSLLNRKKKYKCILQFIHNTNDILLAPEWPSNRGREVQDVPMSIRGTVNYNEGPKLLTILSFFTVYNTAVTTATVILLILSITACLLAFFWGKLTRVLHKRIRCRGRQDAGSEHHWSSVNKTNKCKRKQCSRQCFKLLFIVTVY